MNLLKHNPTSQPMTMKHTATILAAGLITTAAHAATVITDYDNSTGPGDPGFLYLDKIIMSATDSWSDTVDVGGWSYRNTNSAANPNRGWGHTSDWFLLELTAPGTVQVTMTGVQPDAWAGFVIYAGESLNDDADEAHNYSNNGLQIAALNGGWDFNGPGGTPGLTYVGHAHSATPSPNASGTWSLGPGLYTIAFGNAANSAENPTAKSFAVSIAVPEPSVAVLGAVAALGLGLRRRRV
jgi:hypothetical protein